MRQKIGYRKLPTYCRKIYLVNKNNEKNINYEIIPDKTNLNQIILIYNLNSYAIDYNEIESNIKNFNDKNSLNINCYDFTPNPEGLVFFLNKKNKEDKISLGELEERCNNLVPTRLKSYLKKIYFNS